ncbi:hypothetical protein VUR80DRAFT_2838 [Thermomyces stellatus]
MGLRRSSVPRWKLPLSRQVKGRYRARIPEALVIGQLQRCREIEPGRNLDWAVPGVLMLQGRPPIASLDVEGRGYYSGLHSPTVGCVGCDADMTEPEAEVMRALCPFWEACGAGLSRWGHAGPWFTILSRRQTSGSLREAEPTRQDGLGETWNQSRSYPL